MLAVPLLLMLAGNAAQGAGTCFGERPAPAVTEPAPEGYRVIVGPTRGGPDVEFRCRVEIRDPAGRLVLSKTGFNTSLHRASGMDVDNDGSPDIIVGYDTGGGNRCCWHYAVLSLHPRPHVLGEFDNVGFERDPQGRTVMWTTHPFYDLGPTMAESPTIGVLQQFRQGRLQNITREMCGEILAGTSTARWTLSAEREALTDANKAASRTAGTGLSFEVGATRVSALTMALQMQYCGRPDEARALVNDVWPAAERDAVVTQVVASARSVP